MEPLQGLKKGPAAEGSHSAEAALTQTPSHMVLQQNGSTLHTVWQHAASEHPGFGCDSKQLPLPGHCAWAAADARRAAVVQTARMRDVFMDLSLSVMPLPAAPEAGAEGCGNVPRRRPAGRAVWAGSPASTQSCPGAPRELHGVLCDAQPVARPRTPIQGRVIFTLAAPSEGKAARLGPVSPQGLPGLALAGQTWRAQCLAA